MTSSLVIINIRTITNGPAKLGGITDPETEMETMNEYQKQALTFALPHIINSREYAALGLCGEAGEVAEKVKKGIRDGKLNPEMLALELGDVLWYLSLLSHQLGYTLEEIAKMNLWKLESRKKRELISGEGDVR